MVAIEDISQCSAVVPKLAGAIAVGWASNAVSEFDERILSPGASAVNSERCIVGGDTCIFTAQRELYEYKHPLVILSEYEDGKDNRPSDAGSVDPYSAAESISGTLDTVQEPPLSEHECTSDKNNEQQIAIIDSNVVAEQNSEQAISDVLQAVAATVLSAQNLELVPTEDVGTEYHMKLGPLTISTTDRALQETRDTSFRFLKSTTEKLTGTLSEKQKRFLRYAQYCATNKIYYVNTPINLQQHPEESAIAKSTFRVEKFVSDTIVNWLCSIFLPSIPRTVTVTYTPKPTPEPNEQEPVEYNDSL